MPSATGAPPVGRERPGRLCGVLDHRQAERLDLRDRRDVAEQMHDDHRLRARRYDCLHGFWRDAERLRIDVAEDRARAPVGGIASAEA